RSARRADATPGRAATTRASSREWTRPRSRQSEKRRCRPGNLRLMEGSTRLTLRISPGSRSSRVVGRFGSAWRVSAQAPPGDGKANAAVIALLADALSVPRRDVELVAGSSARDKVVAVRGRDGREIERLLGSAARSTA